jgi:hypothetical protein
MKFVKGQSGNPSGRAKKDPKFQEALQKATPKALETLLSVLDNLSAEDSDRIRAAIWILEKAHGKPAQELEHSGEGGGAINFVLRIGDAPAKPGK